MKVWSAGPWSTTWALCRLGVVWIDPGLSVIQPSEGMIMDVVFSHVQGYYAFGVYVWGDYWLQEKFKGPRDVDHGISGLARVQGLEILVQGMG